MMAKKPLIPKGPFGNYRSPSDSTEDGWIGDERTVDVHVRQLRRKLGDDLPLATVRGHGYRLG